MNSWEDGTCLYHHGIKGMKWGVRRFQRKDGSLTPAGRKRYDVPDEINKSTHRQRIEKKYMESKGMTKDEAEQAAAKRIRTEKFLAVAAVTSVAALTATYTHKQYNAEQIISKNTEFQRIMKMDPNSDIIKGNRDYVSFDKRDKAKYKGLLGKSFQDAIDSSRALDEKLGLELDKSIVENVTMKYKNDIKVASPKMSRETFAKLYKDNDEFKKAFDDANGNLARTIGKTGDLGSKVKAKLSKGNVTDLFLKTKAYDAFNVGIADKSKEAEKAHKIFFDEMKKQGVQAIQDINDKKFSGYGAKNPLIIFDGDYNSKRTELGKQEIEKNYKKEMGKLNAKSLGKVGAMYVGAYGGMIGGLSGVNRKTVVANYKKQHPDTKLTNDEIYKKVINEQQKAAREVQSIPTPKPKQTNTQTITLGNQTFKIKGNPNNNKYVKAINDYKKAHPDSKMSDNEIYKMLFEK